MVLPRKRVQNYCFGAFDTIPKNGDLGAWTFMARPSCNYQNDKENTKKKGEGLRVS